MVRITSSPEDLIEAFVSFIPEDHLIAIGRVTTQWSMLEGFIDAYICRLAELRIDLGRIFCAQMQMQSKLDTFSALLIQRRPSLHKPFKPTMEYIRECLVGRRNLIIHGVWLSEGETIAVRKFSARGQLVSQHIADLEEVNALASDIAEVIVYLSRFFDKKLPPLKHRRDGRAHKHRGLLPLQEFANRKKLALQLLASEA